MQNRKFYELMEEENTFMESYDQQEQQSLRNHIIRVPECINECRGIRIFGKTIKSIVATTDIAIICNINADAVMAVYPFTPQTAIIRAIMTASSMPVLAGVGGGTTRGARTWNIANNAEQLGAFGVVLNSPVDNETITGLRNLIEIPVIVTVVSEDTDIEARMRAGASMINVSGAERTPEIVRKIREKYPKITIIATGGLTDESIERDYKGRSGRHNVYAAFKYFDDSGQDCTLQKQRKCRCRQRESYGGSLFRCSENRIVQACKF